MKTCRWFLAPLLTVLAACSSGSDPSGASAAQNFTGPGTSTSTDDPNLGTLVGTQTSNRGHNEFKLFSKVGPQVNNGTAFSHDETFSVVYIDKPGPDDSFFRADAEVDCFVQVDTIVVHHGGEPNSPKSTSATIELVNNGNNTYTGKLAPITLSGATGDSDTVVTSVDVAFFVNGGRIAEQDPGQNYHFVLDNVN
jgi:hypothetical protein